MAFNNKTYGLTLPVPKKKLNEPIKMKNVFGNDSDSDENNSGKKPIQTQNRTKAQERTSNLIIDRALEEDATVFQYDEVYDEMELKKGHLDGKKKKEVDRKPKYIQNLLVQAEKRKIEYERRNERMIQKEREAEGDAFKDKEAFVTSSYKKKLEELKEMDEEDKKLSLIEDINDVTKQKDMGSFYRHLYKSELCKEESDIEIKTKKPDKNRQYRKRASSEGSEIINTDDDKDSIMSDSTSPPNSPKREKLEDKIGNLSGSEEGEIIDKSSSHSSDKELKEELKSNTQLENYANKDKQDRKEKIKKPVIPKINIWEKRTVGEVFLAAQQRYFERKMARVN
ncbi:nuclear speckle splicing regulatory protein 1 isoform X1 [Daktulosphaira vitifoliae]|uniref:nuclear speckle splicing regulatory protein 1 isoform X1 n=1 Tax=Daktulosphaira vitifoliae TaxID=58002 RepID=UPI0021AAA869|nr:nuclear speckle splicing regulatory protein 1 isoform X1 [Daktulosphaira vitifoliae]